jgi:hypothetical protein
MKVSWQVTGIRRDPWASAHRVHVEQDKTAKERGYYMHPDLYGRPADSQCEGMYSLITLFMNPGYIGTFQYYIHIRRSVIETFGTHP